MIRIVTKEAISYLWKKVTFYTKYKYIGKKNHGTNTKN